MKAMVEWTDRLLARGVSRNVSAITAELSNLKRLQPQMMADVDPIRAARLPTRASASECLGSWGRSI